MQIIVQDFSTDFLTHINENPFLINFKKAFETGQINFSSDFLFFMPMALPKIRVNRTIWSPLVYKSGSFNVYDPESPESQQSLRIDKFIPERSILGELACFTSEPETVLKAFTQAWKLQDNIDSSEVGELYKDNKKFFAFDSKILIKPKGQASLLLIGFICLLKEQFSLEREDKDIHLMGRKSIYGYLPVSSTREYLNQVIKVLQNDPVFK